MIIYANPSAADLVNEYAGIILPVTLFPSIVLPSLHLEHDDLAVPVLLYNGAGYSGTIHDGATDFDLGSLTHHENAIEIHLLAYISRELFHLDDIALVDAVLLTACLDYCVHVFSNLPITIAEITELMSEQVLLSDELDIVNIGRHIGRLENMYAVIECRVQSAGCRGEEQGGVSGRINLLWYHPDSHWLILTLNIRECNRFFCP